MQTNPTDIPARLDANRRRDARRSWMLGAIFGAVGLVGAAGIMTFWIFLAPDAKGQPPARSSVWDGSTSITCNGNDHVVATNVTSSYPIAASGNCHITLTNCTITAPIAITLAENAHLAMSGGRVAGAVNASDNAHLTFAGTAVSGPVRTTGNAHVVGAP